MFGADTTSVPAYHYDEKKKKNNKPIGGTTLLLHDSVFSCVMTSLNSFLKSMNVEVFMDFAAAALLSGLPRFPEHTFHATRHEGKVFHVPSVFLYVRKREEAEDSDGEQPHQDRCARE